MREWVRISWHLGGMTHEQYMELTWNERLVLQLELSDFIAAANDIPAKQLRK